MTPLDKLRRYEASVRWMLGRMGLLAKEAGDPDVADRFKATESIVQCAVGAFEWGPGNPCPSVPAYAELGGES